MSQKFISTDNSVQLSACPNRPNCVSSQSTDSAHRIDPLHHQLSQDKALAWLRQLIEEMSRTELIQATPEYLHYEFRSAIFGFVDDVEFVIGKTPGVIHVRSASRMGYWDLGVNRRRVEKIREVFASNQD